MNKEHTTENTRPSNNVFIPPTMPSDKDTKHQLPSSLFDLKACAATQSRWHSTSRCCRSTTHSRRSRGSSTAAHDSHCRLLTFVSHTPLSSVSKYSHRGKSHYFLRTPQTRDFYILPLTPAFAFYIAAALISGQTFFFFFFHLVALGMFLSIHFIHILLLCKNSTAPFGSLAPSSPIQSSLHAFPPFPLQKTAALHSSWLSCKPELSKACKRVAGCILFTVLHAA